MALNLVKLLESKMQQSPLKAIDPNTQAAGDENEKSPAYLYQRAVMAAALVGVYQFSRDENNVSTLLKATTFTKFPDQIFHHEFPLLEEKIKEYSHHVGGDTRKEFEEVLKRLAEILHDHFGEDKKAVKDFLSDQRTNILSYIPGELETGTLLNDSSLDDRTNKMHGPFSDFTHWMGQMFSKSDK